MWVSVIVPTYNRARSLKRLLESFEVLDWSDAAKLEVLVVDNGSTDRTRTLLSTEQAKCCSFSLRILEEGRRGKASALNRGLSSAKGDVIIVIDDDVVAHPQCLTKHLETYRLTHFDAVQGRVLPGVDFNGNPADPNRLREYNIPHIDYGEQICEIRGLTGTNMSFQREVFAKVGFFDTRLGPGAAGFSEDTEYSMRIRKAGFKIGYTPHAIVYHELNPNRYGREYNRMVEYRKGLSRSLYRQDSIPFRVIPDLMANCVRYGLYRLLGRTQKAYKTEGRIMKCWGYLAGKRHGVNSPDSHGQA
jgi:glycosyltransferase involved in cell wall biosynthesis